MIAKLKGELIEITKDGLIIEAGNLGFLVHISDETSKVFFNIGESVVFEIYTHVREDTLALYGFLTREEKDVFESLLSISGIGPKSALQVLSSIPLFNLKTAVNEGKPEILTGVSGIGKKTAERIVLELRGKLLSTPDGSSKNIEAASELEEVLISLGYPKDDVKNVIQNLNNKNEKLEIRLKEALKLLKKK